jgi:hypothetical protein
VNHPLVRLARLFHVASRALKDKSAAPFATLQKYLAPGGAVLTEDETGFDYTSFVLRRSGP